MVRIRVILLICVAAPFYNLLAGELSSESSLVTKMGNDLIKKFDLLATLDDLINFDSSSIEHGLIDADRLDNLLNILDISVYRDTVWYREKGHFDRYSTQKCYQCGYERLDEFSIKSLIDAVIFADFLGLNDWKILQPVFDNLKSRISLSAVRDLIGEHLENNLDIHVPSFYVNEQSLGDLASTGKQKNMIKSISWQPDGKGYFIIFDDNTAQRYNTTGQKIGARLSNVAPINGINWQPGGGDCLIIFGFGTQERVAQFYNEAGTTVGPEIKGVETFLWHPQGRGYFIKTLDDKQNMRWYNSAPINYSIVPDVDKIYWQPNGKSFWGRMWGGGLSHFSMNMDGGRLIVRRTINHGSEIYWQPVGRDYFILFDDGWLHRYNEEGEEVGERIGNVSNVFWSPNGQAYIVRFKDGRAQLYSADGSETDTRLSHVTYSGISWQPNSQSYFIRFTDGSIQQYSNAGQKLGISFANVKPHGIYWQPNGTDYFLLFGNDTAQRYKDGVKKGLPLVDIKEINWKPDGQDYFVVFNNGTANFGQFHEAIYELNLTFWQNLLIQMVLNEFSKNGHEKVFIDQDLMSWLPESATKLLVDYGYLDYNSKSRIKLALVTMAALLAAYYYRN